MPDPSGFEKLPSPEGVARMPETPVATDATDIKTLLGDAMENADL